MKFFYKNRKSLLRAGLIYEYSGQLKISLKVYLLFLISVYLSPKLNIRLFCCCHWTSVSRKRTLAFIKNTYFKNLFDIEKFSFLFKYYQYNGFFRGASNLLGKFLDLINQKKFKNKIYSKNIDNFFYVLTNMLRLITLTKNRISKTYKINKLFHKIKIFQKNKKRYCILNRSLIHLCNCLEGYIRQKLLIDYKGQFEKWVEIPLIIQIFWYFNDYHEFNGNSLDLSKKEHNTNIKFDFFKKKKNLILINKFHEDLFYRSNISNHILAYSDSYCSFYRNLKPNLYFILKFDKKSFEPGFKKFVLNIIDCCAFIEKNNQYSYILYKQISRKLGLKKFKFTPSLFFSTSGAEKHLINFNKSYIARLNYMAEEFYEKKK